MTDEIAVLMKELRKAVPAQYGKLKLFNCASGQWLPDLIDGDYIDEMLNAFEALQEKCEALEKEREKLKQDFVKSVLRIADSIEGVASEIREEVGQ